MPRSSQPAVRSTWMASSSTRFGPSVSNLAYPSRACVLASQAESRGAAHHAVDHRSDYLALQSRERRPPALVEIRIQPLHAESQPEVRKGNLHDTGHRSAVLELHERLQEPSEAPRMFGNEVIIRATKTGLP